MVNGNYHPEIAGLQVKTRVDYVQQSPIAQTKMAAICALGNRAQFALRALAVLLLRTQASQSNLSAW